MVTRAALAAALAVSAAIAADVATGGDGTTRTRLHLLVLTAVFAVRVLGQVLVWRRSPAWLPPMAEWNLVPYRILLPIQLLFLAVMLGIPFTLGESRSDDFGVVLQVAAGVYAAAMLVRYTARMSRRPDQRWLGGAIPIVFHVVLATYLFAWGGHHRA